MAMATSSPPCEPDLFELGIYTPKNLARVEITDIDISPVRSRLAQTPSSPLTRICNATIAEGQQLDEFPTLPSLALHERQSPIDITEAADQLADEQTPAHNAKIRVFRTFCTHFNRVAEEFPSGLERDFAQHFSVSFLEFWKQALGSTPSASTPTYSSVAATATAAAIATGNEHPPHPEKTSELSSGPTPMRRRGTTSVTPFALTLRARPDLNLIRSQRQAEWADDLGVSALEASQKWHPYAVNNCPRRLTDVYGNELDYDTAARDEINHQTGLTPVSIRTPRRDNKQLHYKTLIVSFLEPTKRP
ncbi:hypothetical protein MAJ_10087, partial [Metarhizium majus ARSEF 297]